MYQQLKRKKGHKCDKCQRKQGGIYGMLWRKESKGDNEVILLKSQKNKRNNFLRYMKSFEKTAKYRTNTQNTMANFLLLKTSNAEETSSSHY